MRIILGSQSKSRKEILQKLGFEFEVLPAGIDEKAIRDKDPQKLTLSLARAKLDALKERLSKLAGTDTILITADQVVFCNEKILEKPESSQEARKFWKMYQACDPEVVNGVCVYSFKTDKLVCKNEVSKVSFKGIPQEVVEELVKGKEIYRAAGGFIVEHPKIANYARIIKGSSEAVMGFSGNLVLELIKEVTQQQT